MRFFIVVLQFVSQRLVLWHHHIVNWSLILLHHVSDCFVLLLIVNLLCKCWTHWKLLIRKPFLRKRNSYYSSEINASQPPAPTVVISFTCLQRQQQFISTMDDGSSSRSESPVTRIPSPSVPAVTFQTRPSSSTTNNYYGNAMASSSQELSTTPNPNFAAKCYLMWSSNSSASNITVRIRLIGCTDQLTHWLHDR